MHDARRSEPTQEGCFKRAKLVGFLGGQKKFTKEHAHACYQPNVTSLFHRQLFKYFHDEGILFSLAHDFNFVGGFQAYWTELFTLCKEHRPDFGERPNKATFDPDADHKIRHNANPPFTPYELTKKGYDDCMLLFAHYTCVDYMLRGAIEVSNFIKILFQFIDPPRTYILLFFSIRAIQSFQGSLCTWRKEGWRIQGERVLETPQPCDREEEETVAPGLPLQKGQRSVRHGRFHPRQLFNC